MKHTLETFRAELETMVADAAMALSELRALRVCEDDQRCVASMASELNGMCLALRELDEERYEDINFNDPEWIVLHCSRLK